MWTLLLIYAQFFSVNTEVTDRLYYLPRAIIACYSQHTQIIPSLKEMVAFKYKRTPPLCICEAWSDFSPLPKRVLELRTSEVSRDTCRFKSGQIGHIFEECSSYTAKSCMAQIWLSGDLDPRPERLPSSVKDKGLLIGCGLNKETEGTSTIAVKVDEIGAFGVGYRCNKEKIVQYLNENKIERYRKGSFLYYRILIDPETDFVDFCDPRLIKEGSSMQIFYSCSQQAPAAPIAAQNCVSECRQNNSCTQGMECDTCNPEKPLHTTAESMRKCFEDAGYYIFATGSNICEPNVEPGSWAVNFDIYDTDHGDQFLSDYVGEDTYSDEVSYMGAYIGNGYVLTINAARHGGPNVVRFSRKNPSSTNPEYTTIASGGSKNIIENQKNEQHMSFQEHELHDFKTVDLGLRRLRKKIPNLKPLCITSELSLPDLSSLKVFGWSNGGNNGVLKEPAITAEAATTHEGGLECATAPIICLDINLNKDLLCDMDSGTALAGSVEYGGETIWYLYGIFEGKRDLPFTNCRDDENTKIFIDTRNYTREICGGLGVNLCSHYYFYSHE